jgi:hypothetical protein
MVHCGFEGTAATDAIRHPLKMLKVARNGVKTDGPMAPDIDLSKQRPAKDVFMTVVESEMARIKQVTPDADKKVVNVADA